MPSLTIIIRHYDKCEEKDRNVFEMGVIKTEKKKN